MWLSRILLAAGILCVGAWTASQVVPLIWQAWANRQLDQALRGSTGTSKPSPAAPLETGRLIGRLVIPRLDLTSIVREGDDDTTLSLALGHIPGTALPGQKGNVGIAGHRDTIFRPLREIQKDDLIRFETISGTRTYQVDSTRIVKPQDVGVLKARGTPSLTLVTCYPFYYVGSAPERFIVSAHEVSTDKHTPPVTEVSEKEPVMPAPAVLKTAAHVSPATALTSRSFVIQKGQTKELGPGITLGISDIDPLDERVYGWIWLKSEGRTLIVQGQPAYQTFEFYEGDRRRQLRFTGLSRDGATGHLL